MKTKLFPFQGQFIFHKRFIFDREPDHGVATLTPPIGVRIPPHGEKASLKKAVTPDIKKLKDDVRNSVSQTLPTLTFPPIIDEIDEEVAAILEDSQFREVESQLTPIRKIGKFPLLKEIGKGGMAQVYLSKRYETDPREIAVKVVTPPDVEILERFIAEARTLAQFHHRHIAGIHEVGWFRDSNTPLGISLYLVMPKYERTAKSDAENIRVMEAGQKNAWVRQHAIGLAEAIDAVHHTKVSPHNMPVLHRDIKPDNFLIHEDKIPLLSDFGFTEAQSPTLEHKEQISGTLAYMAPEIAVSNTTPVEVGPSADWYSFGASLYNLLTGKEVISGNSATDYLIQLIDYYANKEKQEKVLSELRKHLKENRVPSHLAEFIFRLIQPRAEMRIAPDKVVKELKNALDTDARDLKGIGHRILSMTEKFTKRIKNAALPKSKQDTVTRVNIS